MAGNTTTKKEFNAIKAGIASKGQASRTVNVPNRPGVGVGQMRTAAGEQKFANPMNNGAPAAITSLEKTYNDIGEMSGFITDGYLDKQGTPFGEAAKFNYLPPGMDISNQMNAEINQMPLRKLVAESYPGDGWMPAPRDLPE